MEEVMELYTLVESTTEGAKQTKKGWVVKVPYTEAQVKAYTEAAKDYVILYEETREYESFGCCTDYSVREIATDHYVIKDGALVGFMFHSRGVPVDILFLTDADKNIDAELDWSSVNHGDSTTDYRDACRLLTREGAKKYK